MSMSHGFRILGSVRDEHFPVHFVIMMKLGRIYKEFISLERACTFGGVKSDGSSGVAKIASIVLPC